LATIQIKCDQMPDGWNYDLCCECKHFQMNKTAKGLKWRCKLNSGSAPERRRYYMIWAQEYLIARDCMNEKSRDAIIVDYVGKRRRKRNHDNQT
jgi:hypothetical protein